MSVAPPSVSVHSYNTGLKGKGGEGGGNLLEKDEVSKGRGVQST